MNITKPKSPMRFPRIDIWKGIPRLDLSKIKKSQWVIDDFLAQGGIQLIYGAAGTRKTTALLIAGWAVSHGRPFLAKKTQRRHVLYLDYENPFDVVKSYCSDLKIDPSDPAFTIWDRRSSEPTPLPDDKRLRKFVRHCKNTTGHAPWIIFDSWTSLLKSGESGNAIGEAAPIFKAIRHLCDIGATCTVIDHTGKKGKQPIGTSAKMTQMSSSFHFSVQEESIGLDGRSAQAVIRAESNLKRYTPSEFGTFSIEVKAARDKDDEWHTVSVELTTDVAVLNLKRQIERMKQLIRSNPSLGHEELAALAKQKKIVKSRNEGRRLLQEGTPEHWKTIPRGGRKVTYKAEK